MHEAEDVEARTDPDMRVVSVVAGKGGVGKSTLSASLAVEAERVGAGPVAIVDTDPQQTLAKWWSRRGAETPQLGKVDLASIRKGVRFLADQGYALVIIDTPPSIVREIAKVIAASDLALIPTRPSPLDLEAVTTTIDLVEAEGKPMVFVINGAAHRARITIEAAHQLSQHGTLAPVTMMQRTDYATAMISGDTVVDIDPGGKSAGEVSVLWQYLAKRLAKLPAATMGAAA